MGRTKILLISGFTNSEIREHLTFRKNNVFFHYLIKLFHLPVRVGEFRDTTPWVRSIIEYYEGREDIELHVMAPHILLDHPVQSFVMRDVTYHYYRSEFTSFVRLVKSYKIWKMLQRTGHYAKKIIKEVKPDLIVLSGAENPQSSVSVLYAGGYPRVCLCQVVYNDPDRYKYTRPNHLIAKLEKDVFANLNYFGVYCKKHYELLKQQTNNKYIFKYNYPPRSNVKAIKLNHIEKQYDFVNFAAAHSLAKGTHDSIRALALVKREYPNVTLNIVGGCDEKLKIELSQLIKELGLEDNVIFTPFFEKRIDLIFHIQKSRFAVLPCKLDNTSGTMNQSMHYGIPLIVYKTMGTMAFNKDMECALIAEMNDINGLANHMLTLMNDADRAERLKRNAIRYRETLRDSSRTNWERMTIGFQYIIDNYKNGVAIPQELLFDPRKDS